MSDYMNPPISSGQDYKKYKAGKLQMKAFHQGYDEGVRVTTQDMQSKVDIAYLDGKADGLKEARKILEESNEPESICSACGSDNMTFETHDVCVVDVCLDCGIEE